MVPRDLFIHARIRGFPNQIRTQIDRQMRANEAGYPGNSSAVGREKG